MEEHQNGEGQLHREDGPAVIYADGSQEWYINGDLHREGGPAIINADGSQEWYINGKRHRVDGPAIVYADGSQSWWLNGEYYRYDGLPYILDNYNHRMTLDNGSVVPMSADDYEKYRYKPTGRFTKAAPREN